MSDKNETERAGEGAARAWSAVDLVQLETVADHMETSWAFHWPDLDRHRRARLNEIAARALREFVRVKRAEGVVMPAPAPRVVDEMTEKKVEMRVAARKPRPVHPKPVFRGAQ